jgi:hypothetical protein
MYWLRMIPLTKEKGRREGKEREREEEEVEIDN